MLNSAMKQKCKPLQCKKIRITRNPGLYTGLNLKPEREITSPNLTFMFKAQFRPESQIYRVSQDVRNCGASVPYQSRHA